MSNCECNSQDDHGTIGVDNNELMSVGEGNPYYGNGGGFVQGGSQGGSQDSPGGGRKVSRDLVVVPGVVCILPRRYCDLPSNTIAFHVPPFLRPTSDTD